MRSISRIFVLVWLLCISGILAAQTDFVTASTKVPQHPRLLLLKGEEKAIQKAINADQTWKSVHEAILAEARSFDSQQPVQHIKIGKRLLDKSRECLRRVFFLSYAWRMTHDKKYFDRAEKELLAVSAFSDWNPSHFLDVAEMTLAVAIGYDWLYDDLSVSSRTIIKRAILENGLKPSLDPKNNGWLRVTNNWNQVCNGGMAYGALAIYEDEPELARNIINRAITTVELPMKEYGPDGGYPEGYNYWGYGTAYNILLLSALEKTFGTDFGLSQKNNFLLTAGYLEHLTGATRQPFNFFDAGLGADVQPAMFWFAARQKDPSLLFVEKSMLKQDTKKIIDERILPAIMIWGKDINVDKIPAPKTTMWTGNGRNPVVMMRTSWTDTAIYVGFKGGSPSSSHAHMDAGSFVMDADGVRWAMDFGMQNYESLESKGVDLWNMRQNSQRWQIFRYNNYAHNTLTVNNELQKVEGKAEILSSSSQPLFMNAVVDMTAVYKGLLTKSYRGVAIVNKSYVVVRDEVETGTADAVIRWTMATATNARIVDDHTIEFTKNGKKLSLTVQQPALVTMKTWPTDPVQPYDAPNPGTVLAGFEVKVPAGTKVTIEVLLVPSKNEQTKKINIPALANWPVK